MCAWGKMAGILLRFRGIGLRKAVLDTHQHQPCPRSRTCNGPTEPHTARGAREAPRPQINRNPPWSNTAAAALPTLHQRRSYSKSLNNPGRPTPGGRIAFRAVNGLVSRDIHSEELHVAFSRRIALRRLNRNTPLSKRNTPTSVPFPTTFIQCVRQ